MPYTGAYPIEWTIDHLGPIARNMTDLATFLTVIAGPDGNDPRQSHAPSGIDYTAGLDDGIEGLRVGVVAEGFGFEGLSDPDSDAQVETAAHRLADAGAVVETISIPEHRDALHVWNVIATDGAMWQMIRGNGLRDELPGPVRSRTHGADHARLAHQCPPDVPDTEVRSPLRGARFRSHRRRRLRPSLQCATPDQRGSGLGSGQTMMCCAIRRCPSRPSRSLHRTHTVDEYVARALEMIPNTAVSNVTGNPDLTIPVSVGEGMPVGMSIVGRQWDETTLIRVGRAYEKLVGGFALSPVAEANLGT